MKQLTKHEIIDEIAGLYTLSTRSMGLVTNDSNCPSDTPVCKYNGDGGKVCAFAHMVREESRCKLIENKTANALIGNGVILDTDLKEQYRGHEVAFYGNIQRLHDSEENWNENGLSDRGRRAVANLKQAWPK